MGGTRKTPVWARGPIAVGLGLIWAAGTFAQETPPPGTTPATPPSAAAAEPAPDPRAGLALVQAPGTRFQLIEGYREPGVPDADGKIGAYRVAFWESMETAVEMARATPERSRTVVVAKCSELPAIVQGNVVLGLIRRYDAFRVEPDRRKGPSDPLPLRGREVWVQRGRGNPVIMTIGSTQPLLEPEFRFAADQQVYVPDLADALPDLPVKIGDTWKVQPVGARTLMGGPVLGGDLTGELIRVEPSANDPSRVRATLKVTGRVQSAASVAALNAELAFEFPVPDAAGATAAPGRLVRARGAIVRLALSQQEVLATDQNGQRGKVTKTRQIVLERRLGLAEVDPLVAPSEPPTPTRNNSWVRSVDATRRFHFDHPQDYAPGPLGPGEDGVHLMRAREGGPDDLFIAFKPRDRANGDELARTVRAGWTTAGFEVASGPSGWLPEAEWEGRRVFRLELGLTFAVPPGGDAPPVHASFEAFLVRFPRDATAYVHALTAQADPTGFRQETAEIVRTLQVDAPAAAAPGPAAAAPASPATPAPANDGPPPIPPSTSP